MGASLGDDGFTAFFLAEYVRVVRTIELMTGDRASAEDVAQDAFAAAFARWRRIARYDRPGAWVRRVAIRDAVRLLRRGSRPAVASSNADGTAESDLDVRRAVLTLPAAQRAAIILHYYEDRPVSEIATILRCATGTAKVHLHRARKQLAKALSEETVDDVL